MIFNTPLQLLNAYKNGFIGSVCDKEGQERLLAESKHPYFGAAAQSIADSGKGQMALLFKNLLKFDQRAFSERQTTGDCYMPGTIVLGKNCKNIENIEVGDIVYGPDGTLTKVISTQKKISYNPIITIKTNGGLPLEVTSDHLILVARKEKTLNKNTDTIVINGKTLVKKWINASSIKKGDFLVTPKNIEKTKSPNNDFMNHRGFDWFLGYFLGDGYSDGKAIEITFAEHQEYFYNKCFNFLTSIGFNPKYGKHSKAKKTKAFRLRCWCPSFAKWLRSECYDENKDKVFPFWAIGSKEIVEGLIDSDGFRKNNKEYFNSSSKSLAYGVYYSYLEMGYEPTIGLFKRSKNGSFKTKKQSYRIICIFNKKKRYILSDSKNIFVPVSKINIKEGPNLVYDIGVEHKEHAFIANGFIAHNCVSHAARNGVDITRSTEIINGDKESFIVRSATEGIYGVRGHGGQGMTCERAVRFLTTDGGILLRKKYGSHDLSVYNGRMAASWGRSGTPRVLVEEAKKNQVKTVSNIRSVAEARDALFNGYGVFFCSNLGFSSTRDKNGISQRSGTWMHAMSFGAMDDTRDILNETLFLILNSWGAWNGGPKRLQQPDGSFWVRQSVVEDIIAQGSMWALSNVDGFPAQKIRWSLNEVL